MLLIIYLCEAVAPHVTNFPSSTTGDSFRWQPSRNFKHKHAKTIELNSDIA